MLLTVTHICVLVIMVYRLPTCFDSLIIHRVHQSTPLVETQRWPGDPPQINMRVVGETGSILRQSFLTSVTLGPAIPVVFNVLIVDTFGQICID
jgi:hypothetical protein